MYLLSVFAISFLISLILTKIISRNVGSSNRSILFIPTGVGGILILSVMPSFLVAYFLGLTALKTMLSFFYGILCMGIIGFSDDITMNAGTVNNGTGLNGIMKGSVQQASIKAIFAFFTASTLGLIYSSNFVYYLLNTSAILLFTNMFNAIDGAAGRVVKTFFAFAVLIMLITRSPGCILSLLIMLATIAAYSSLDIKGQISMGWTGANILGVWLGVTSVETVALTPMIVLVLVLLLINIILEVYGADTLFRRNGILKAVDRWGRAE